MKLALATKCTQMQECMKGFINSSFSSFSPFLSFGDREEEIFEEILTTILRVSNYHLD